MFRKKWFWHLYVVLALMSAWVPNSLARPKKRRGAPDYKAMQSAAHEFQVAVQQGYLKEVKRVGRKAKRYKDYFQFIGFAWQAVLRGEIDIVKEVFSVAGRNSFDINEKHEKNGGTLLHAACYSGMDQVVAFLLENGADPSLLDKEGNNAAHSILHGWKNLFFNFHGSPKDAERPRKIMTSDGHAQSLEHLARHVGGNKHFWNHKNNKQLAPIILIVRDFNTKALHVVVNDESIVSAIDFHARDPMGNPILNLAVDTSWFVIRVSKWLTGHGNVAVSKDLLEKYPNSPRHDSFLMINFQTPGGIRTQEGNSYDRRRLDAYLFAWHLESIVRPLLNIPGFPTDRTDAAMNSALHLSAYYGNTPVVRALLEHWGPDSPMLVKMYEKTNSQGRTALDNAIVSNHEDTVALMKQASPKVVGISSDILRPYEILQVDAGHSVDDSVEYSIDADGSGAVVDEVHAPERIGGWRSRLALDNAKNLLPPNNHCDLDVLTDANKTLFKQYLRAQKPVLLRQLEDVMQWPAFKTWTRERLYNKYGDVNFKVYKRSKLTSPTSFDMKLSEYLDYMDGLNNKSTLRESEESLQQQPIWLVETKLSEAAKDMVDKDIGKFEFYEYLLNQNGKGLYKYNNYQLMIAPAMAGASPHFHNSALNLLVFGEKLWFLYPPAVAFYATQHVHLWYNHDYPNLLKQGVRPLRCRQQPGDVIWVPDMWGHGVIYTKDSVGVAHLYSG